MWRGRHTLHVILLLTVSVLFCDLPVAPPEIVLGTSPDIILYPSLVLSCECFDVLCSVASVSSFSVVGSPFGFGCVYPLLIFFPLWLGVKLRLPVYSVRPPVLHLRHGTRLLSCGPPVFCFSLCLCPCLTPFIFAGLFTLRVGISGSLASFLTFFVWSVWSITGFFPSGLFILRVECYFPLFPATAAVY